MSFSYNVKEADGISIIELNGDVSIENIEDCQKYFQTLLNDYDNIEISNHRIYRCDLTYFQLLISFKKQAELLNKKVTINNDFIPDLNFFLELSGLKEYIF